MSGAPTATATRVVVVYGGRSAEHEVSCISARRILDALHAQRYDVTVLGVTHDGAWRDVSHAVAGDGVLTGRSESVAPAGGGLPSPSDLDGTDVEPINALRGDGRASDTVVFPIIHGPSGEDGTLQGLLEVAGLPYVGPGVLGSAVAMDKGIAKALFAAAGLPQVRYRILRVDEVNEHTRPGVVAAVVDELGWPVFVKPANLGSTIGISRAGDPDAFDVALALALRYDEYVIIEEQVLAREIELGVLGHVDLLVTGPGETLPSHDFYDYEDKYLLGTAGLAIPADLPAAVTAQAKTIALRACRALRVEGMARVDLFYEDPGRGLLINEVNTIPGFTAISMYPMLWAAEGLSVGDLIDHLLTAARARHARRQALHTRR